MKPFTYYNPVRMHFGEGMLDKLAGIMEDYESPVLIVAGRSSLKKTSTLARIETMLNNKSREYFILNSVKSNPEIEKVREGIEMVRQSNIKFILAAGGGSVIDTAKAIAAGCSYDGDVWDFYTGDAQPQAGLPIGVVLTIAATGSEMNPISVITNPDEKEKVGISSPFMYPQFTIEDPELTLTVNREYTGYSGVDIIAHAVEGYFTSTDSNTPIQDGFTGVIVKIVIDNTRILMKNPDNIEARSNIMWASTLALNGILTAGIGRYRFENHMIGHGLSAYYNTPHGASLSIVIPAWLAVNIDVYRKKIEELGSMIFGLDNAEETVRKLKETFASFDSPVSLEDAGITDIDEGIINSIISTASRRNIDMTRDTLEDIFAQMK